MTTPPKCQNFQCLHGNDVHESFDNFGWVVSPCCVNIVPSPRSCPPHEWSPDLNVTSNIRTLADPFLPFEV